MNRAEEGEAADRPDSPYAWFVLAVLVCVYIFSSMDRMIISILAEDIKKTFAISDEEIGFLHGTAFSVFYALFGYPMGRLIDRWRRTKLLAISITIWSAMTMLSGLSVSMLQLTAARIGVGIGEATASPAGFSLVSDWFTKAKRGTALGIFVAGLGMGSSLALMLGGLISSRWDKGFAGHPPFGLHGWQVTFIAIGLPGLVLALVFASLREPRRGLSDGVDRPGATRIWARFGSDVASVIPPFTLIQAGRAGLGPLLWNLAAAAAATALALWMIHWSHDVMQWVILCIGYYAAFSSAQSMKHRDPPTFALTWKTPSFIFAMLGFGLTSIIQIVTAFWVAPLALRTFHMDKATVGLILGSMVIFQIAGVTLGGWLADFALRFGGGGRIWIGIGSAVLPTPFIAVMCLTHNPWVFFPCYLPVVFLCAAWLAAGGATIQELVLPRMRGTSTATYFFASTLLGSGLGPYFVGKISTATGSLAVGLLWSLAVVPVAAMFLWLCSRRIARDEASKWDRAMAAGEPA